MRLTAYNLLMSLIWSDICILLFCLLRRWYTFIRDYGVVPLIGVLSTGCVRFFLPIELPFTVIIPSTVFLPAIQDALRWEWFWDLSVGTLLLVLWGVVSSFRLTTIFAGVAKQKRKISWLLQTDNTVAHEALNTILPPNTKWRAVVVVSPEIRIPSVTGFFQPTFLLPKLELSRPQLQFILRHELGHFVGKDAWIKLSVSIFKALFWWNPLVYILEKDLDYLLEVRSDFYATEGFSKEQQIGYVNAVTEVIRQVGASKSWISNYTLSISGTQNNDKLYERMRLVFRGNVRRRFHVRILTAFLAVLMILSYSFVIQPQGYPSIEENLIQVDQSNIYLELTDQGTYMLFVNGEYLKTLTKEAVQASQLNELEIGEVD